MARKATAHRKGRIAPNKRRTQTTRRRRSKRAQKKRQKKIKRIITTVIWLVGQLFLWSSVSAIFLHLFKQVVASFRS